MRHDFFNFTHHRLRQEYSNDFNDDSFTSVLVLSLLTFYFIVSSFGLIWGLLFVCLVVGVGLRALFIKIQNFGI